MKKSLYVLAILAIFAGATFAPTRQAEAFFFGFGGGFSFGFGSGWHRGWGPGWWGGYPYSGHYGWYRPWRHHYPWYAGYHRPWLPYFHPYPTLALSQPAPSAVPATSAEK